jgi:hypothetical protein
MITKAQVKVLDFLEYTLQVIEDYDKEFKEAQQKQLKQEKGKKKAIKAEDIDQRADYVKTNYQQLVVFQAQRSFEYVKNTRAYKIADDRIDFEKQYNNSRMAVCDALDFLKSQVVLPVTKNIKLLIDFTTKRISLLVDVTVQSQIVQQIIQFYNVAKVTVTKNYMKLDLNGDGRVTMDDFILLLKTIKSLVENTTIVTKANDVKNELYQKAVTFVNRRQVEEEKKPVVKSDDDDNSTDSVELHNAGEKSD